MDTEEERWEYLVRLDDELLKGGVILSEWCTFIVREADTAFAHGAYLGSILTSVTGIETYLRSEYAGHPRERLVDLIDKATLHGTLSDDLHKLRKYRNRWVHVDSPWDDTNLLESPQDTENELRDVAYFAVQCLRRTLYENPCI